MTLKVKNLKLAGASLAVLALAGAGVVAIADPAPTPAVTPVTAAAKAENFRLTDHRSYSHELFYYRDAPAIVLISHASGAAHLKAAAPALKELQAKYGEKGVKFFLLNSKAGEKRETVAAEMAALGLDMPVLMDDAQLVGSALGVTRAAEVFVVNPKSWQVVYNGPIDDRFAGKTPAKAKAAKAAYLADALEATVAGQPVVKASVKLESPKLAFPDRDRRAEWAQISYANDVAPILQKNCVACHSEGGIGPFAMTSYEMVKGFAPMIREAIRTDRMPPFNADPHVGPGFKDSMNLSQADMKTLVHWIEAGAPRGAGGDPLKASAKPAPEWELGEPDVIITLPEYKIPASGIVDYQNPVVKSPLTEGRWLRASTVNVGDRQAVHHLLSPVGGYAVGAETTKHPENTGVWAEPGANLRFQLHYTPYGKETTDVTRVGLYFYPKGQEPELVRRSTVVLNAGIEIPPHAARHEETAYITFPKDAVLYTVYPHAHYRGENMHVSIQRPGEKEEMILSLPKYDFNWQRGYEFAKPISLPAGTRVITRYQYDNSAANRANPDPSIKVTWGEQSHEEMQYTALGFRWTDETAKNQKPEYMELLNSSRTFGMLDRNIDGKVEREEVRGRMGEMVRANFDRLDADKNGHLDAPELSDVSRMMSRRISDAEGQGVAQTQ
jgi:mono/diheme cytochrome c family protein